MKILIVKISALGDVIQCFPALHFLKQTFPKAFLEWVVEEPYGSLLHAHPAIDRVIEVKTKKWKQRPLKPKSWKEAYALFRSLRETKYDLVIDFQGNIKSGLMVGSAFSKEKIGFCRQTAPEWPNAFFTKTHVTVSKDLPIREQYLALAGAKTHVSSYVELVVREDEQSWIEEMTARKEAKYMVCMGSNWENKKLALSTWETFLKRASQKAHLYFVWGSPKEKEEAKQLSDQFKDQATLLPRMSLPVWQRMIAKMDLVFSVDSSALHLAATTNTSTFSFFGPSLAEVYKPEGARHGVFQGNCPYDQTFIKRCPLLRTCKTGACLKEAQGEKLYAAFEKWKNQASPTTEASRSKSMCDSTS